MIILNHEYIFNHLKTSQSYHHKTSLFTKHRRHGLSHHKICRAPFCHHKISRSQNVAIIVLPLSNFAITVFPITKYVELRFTIKEKDFQSRSIRVKCMLEEYGLSNVWYDIKTFIPVFKERVKPMRRNKN